MTTQRTRLSAHQARLFTPGRRLGWTYRDPRLVAVPFPEPEPAPRPIPARPLERRQAERGRLAARALRILGLIALLPLSLGVGAALLGARAWAYGLGAVAAALVLIGLGRVAAAVAGRRSALRALRETQRLLGEEYEHARRGWAARRAEHARTQAERVEAAPQWHPVSTREALRLDVHGGDRWGWEALLTVHGASLLARRPVLVADFSAEPVCEELAELTTAAGVVVHTERLASARRLATLMEPVRERAALLTCVLAGDTLAEEVARWLAVQVESAARHVPAIIVAGADALIGPPHAPAGPQHSPHAPADPQTGPSHATADVLRELVEVCERRRTPLTLLFRHFGTHPAPTGGAIAFMRLGSHDEAAAAADLVGRGRTFALAQLTRSLSGPGTHPPARDWSSTAAFPQDGGTHVCTVDPPTLRRLPDHALLLAEPDPEGEPSLTAVDCNPALITHPRVAT